MDQNRDTREQTNEVPDTRDDFIKISANLPAAVVKTLKQVAKLKGTSMTEVLRHAISLEAFLIEKEREGSKIISEEKDQKKTQQPVVT